MRGAILVAVIAAAACSVPKKQAIDSDAGVEDAPADAPTDDEAPSTTITTSPDKFSRQGASTFQFSSDDPAATFECRVDTSAAAACSSPYTRTLADGSHHFSVRAIDTAGNGDETPAEYVWSIDTVAPETQLTDAPPAADNSAMVQFAFTSNEANVVFDCSVDGGSYHPCTSGATIGPLGDGTHSFAVRARDRAGNVDLSPAIHAWTIDTSTPDTLLLSSPPDSSASTTATFTFLSPDAGPGASFQCKLDAAAFTACTSPKVISGLTEGPHDFAVRVRDSVGNFDPTPATRSWVVDLTPPATTITGGPSGPTPIASAGFTFTSNEPSVSFACSDDGAAFAPCTSPHEVTGLAQGPHTFAVRATDGAGHTDPTPAIGSWTVDTIQPDITLTGGPAEASTVGPRVIVTFTASEGSTSCGLDAGGFEACTSPEAYSLPAGPHQVRVRASDAAGNVATEVRSFTVACAAPGSAGAVGQLHLDDPGQLLANAVLGGAPAMLGDDIIVEQDDPVAVAGGRFDGALAFDASTGTHVAWPAAIVATPALTFELWAQPAASGGSRDLLAVGDGRVALQVAAASPTTVRFSIAITATGPGAQTWIATSAPVAAGAWHHVLGSLQAPTLRLWVDGVRSEAGGIDAMTSLALDAIRLGGAAASAYTGLLDEIWLGADAITGDEAALARYCPP